MMVKRWFLISQILLLGCYSCDDLEHLSGRIVGFQVGNHVEGMRINESPVAIINSFQSAPDTLITALGLDLFLIYGDSMTVQLTKIDFDASDYILGGVFVTNGYTGASPEGIRLGMTTSQVMDLIGGPDHIFGEDNFQTLSYESATDTFDLNFVDDILAAVHMRRRQ